MIDEAVLEGLGIELAGGNDREVQGVCPVHHLVKGRESSKAAWYMNRETGAWICFSCQQRGSFSHLVELLGGDAEMVEEITIDIMKQKAERGAKEEPKTTKKVKEETPYISDYAYSKHLFPPVKQRESRDITLEMCELYNVRWNPERRCFLLPLITVHGTLVGWQEKAPGYFRNVPDEVSKTLCLFGFQQFVKGEMIFMESPLDVVRLASYGIFGGVATMGSFVSDEQLEAGLRAADKFVLAFDDDEAGDIANDAMTEFCESRSVPFRRFKYPKRNRVGNSKAKFKDIGELPIEEVRAGLAKASAFPNARLRV